MIKKFLAIVLLAAWVGGACWVTYESQEIIMVIWEDIKNV